MSPPDFCARELLSPVDQKLKRPVRPVHDVNGEENYGKGLPTPVGAVVEQPSAMRWPCQRHLYYAVVTPQPLPDRWINRCLRKTRRFGFPGICRRFHPCSPDICTNTSNNTAKFFFASPAECVTLQAAAVQKLCDAVSLS